ncbi:MAG: hypothetical protein CMLOHMNK_02800 [Steroidobacteraceae bacterium]|nr:hypothetical protein [Steroidobacteraceae bacterium]
MFRRRARALPALLAVLGLAACASAPPVPAPATREPIAAVPPRQTSAPPAILRAAEAEVGAPYRYGGTGPQGFDCSGLTQFAYRSAGIAIPRTAAAQRRASQPVPRDALQPGDLVFFASGRDGVDHVGVYAGGGRFVHAPASGRVVSFGYLDDPWYAARFVGAGRFWPDDPKPQTRAAAP